MDKEIIKLFLENIDKLTDREREVLIKKIELMNTPIFTHIGTGDISMPEVSVSTPVPETSTFGNFCKDCGNFYTYCTCNSLA